MNYIEGLELLRCMLTYYGVVFLIKEAVWGKLSERGKDKFDIVTMVGFIWTLLFFNSYDRLIILFSNPSVNRAEISIYTVVFILFSMVGYHSGKS